MKRKREPEKNKINIHMRVNTHSTQNRHNQKNVF